MIDGNYVPSDDEFRLAYVSAATGTFGDGSGRWASTSGVAYGAFCSYGRARHWLDLNAEQHPSGSDYWQL